MGNQSQHANVDALFALLGSQESGNDNAALRDTSGLDALFASLGGTQNAEIIDGDKPKPKLIATFDIETDPGEPPILDRDGKILSPGLQIKPFAWGFFDGSKYVSDTGKDCIEKFVDFIRGIDEPHYIYAHNGGNFDFLFLMPWLEKEMFIINGRIVECRIGPHRLRDSYAIIPVALKAFGDKREIDIQKLHRSKRHRHMPEIMDYLRQDCVGLYKGVAEYERRFGLSLTMATTALKTLEKTYGKKGAAIKRLSRIQDGLFRQFYFGGRVQCFKKGIFRDDMKYYDVNSMYPHVMCAFDHPVSDTFVAQREIDDKTDYAIVEASSKGALPVRTKNGLEFPHSSGTFSATGHEIRMGLKLGTLKINRVVEAYSATERMNFREFVEPLYKMRNEAKLRCDAIDTLFLKLLMNSSYGKLALNPRDFQEHEITPLGGPHPDMADGWEAIAATDSYIVWARSIDAIAPEKIDRKFINVATAASITAAARATLARAIESCTSPAYCDTDSLLARNLPVNDDAMTLGAWKIEAVGDEAAIAAKKIYALFKDGECVKQASKGVRMEPEDIRLVASGGTYRWQSPVPKIKLTGAQMYVSRVISA